MSSDTSKRSARHAASAALTDRSPDDPRRKAASPRKATKAPSTGLKQSGLALWRAVIGVYVLDPAEEVVLTELCRTVDRLEQLHTAARTAKLVVVGSQGPKINPVLAEIRAQQKTVESLAVSLGLPAEPSKAVATRRSQQARAAARVRWLKDAKHGA
jgi:hypothetical protein